MNLYVNLPGQNTFALTAEDFISEKKKKYYFCPLWSYSSYSVPENRRPLRLQEYGCLGGTGKEG